MSSVSSHRRLAKNTIILYVRTFITLVISLFTSRVLLQALGIDNYGIYDVVGGFVTLFSIVTSTLTSTTQRYINFELGKGSIGKPHDVFGASICIHIGIALLMILIFETIGLWFLNNYLNIPIGRLNAANWVFQISIVNFVVGVVCTPYIAVIIAHEHMKAFAYIGLAETLLKLGICYLLYLSPIDRLISYSALLCCISIIIQLIYVHYSRCNFGEAKVSIIKNSKLYKSMFKFAGMNSIGSFAAILSNQGVNIIINIFFGVTVNAARGIANQVQNAVTRFSSDFMTALNPQITKEYAIGNIDISRELSMTGSKFSFYIMLILVIPIMIRCNTILSLWLTDYPSYTVVFVQLTMILSLITVISNPFITEILATGNLKATTWWIGLTRLLIIPIIYILFRCSLSPVFAYIVIIGIDTILIFIRLYILDIITNYQFLSVFIKRICGRILLVLIIAIILNELLDSMIPDTTLCLFIYTLFSMIITMSVIYIVGITQPERVNLRRIIINKIKNYVG